MQVERGLNKWTGRVPPLDLSNVNSCQREAEHRWHKTHSSPKRMCYGMHSGNDGLPFGEFRIKSLTIELIFTITKQFQFQFHFNRSTRLDSGRCLEMVGEFVAVRRSRTVTRIGTEISDEWQSALSNDSRYVFGACSGRRKNVVSWFPCTIVACDEHMNLILLKFCR